MGQISRELEVWAIQLLQSLREARDTPGPGVRGPSSTLEMPRRQSCRPVRLATTTALPSSHPEPGIAAVPFLGSPLATPQPLLFSSWKISLGSASELNVSMWV